MRTQHDHRDVARHRGRELLRLIAGVVAGACALAVLVTAAPAALAADGDWRTSFEPADPQPQDSVSAVVAGAEHRANVTGDIQTGIPGSQLADLQTVTASAENPTQEIAQQLADGDAGTKWLAFETTAWVQYQFKRKVRVARYALTSANDDATRDPKDWRLQASDDGSTWTTVDTRTGETFEDRGTQRTFDVASPQEHTYYRLDVTANNGSATIVQLADWDVSDGGDSALDPDQPMTATVDAGPTGSSTAKPRVGWTGTHSLRYAGTQTGDGRGYASDVLYDHLSVPVTKTSQLDYELFPQLTNRNLKYPSTYAAVDLHFTDGTFLSDLRAPDFNGFELTPSGQGASESVFADQWNHRATDLGAVAEGKTIDQVLLGYDDPNGAAAFTGWVDDIRVSADPPSREHAHLSDYVLTTRGTNSSAGFSRGNNFPATAVPHGFNFWTPVTDAGSDWLYEYQAANDDDNLPRIQAFSASHEPSPWMGERQTFQVMPSPDAVPKLDREQRALPFSHADETARPYEYGVTFQNGMKTEIAPTDHAAVMRFTFKGNQSSLLFDNKSNDGGLTLDGTTVSGFSDVKSGLSTGATRLFVYGVLDKTPTTAKMATGAGRDKVTGYASFDTSTDKTVTLRVATSLIGVDQAKANLEREVPATRSYADVRAAAQDAWDGKLGQIEVEGATPEQQATLYGNLYRFNLYPNSGWEDVDGKPRYASPFSPTAGTSTATKTGAKVVDGKVYVNNGFWDTYRTVWPMYGFLQPKTGGELIDGFVQQYRDNGWIARWSSPGYADLMTGTSSDAAFADAYVKGVDGFDAKSAYEAALKNATVMPTASGVGRKGLESSIFLGYTPTSTGESVSWGLEGFINDAAIANMADKLRDEAAPGSPERQAYADDAAYLRNRSRDYVNMFNPASGFFQGRDARGVWGDPAASFDPKTWWGDYTETNGWNFAFHAPQDGQGLANLYGGRAALGAKLDQFFTTPEETTGTVHEMVEARDVRMGQWGASNQVSHHIPYMYDYAGQPAKTQALVREALGKLWTGSEIGQGYTGDEDNGEMSAWQVFSSLGFYPLQAGSPNYAIGSPLYKKATVHMENGRTLTVEAPDNSRENVYVQGVTLNGVAHPKSYLTQAELAQGGTLRFDMGPKPSAWGTGADDVPPSLTKGDERPAPQQDLTGPGAGTATTDTGDSAADLFDNTSATKLTLAGATPAVTFAFDRRSKSQVSMYTLTSSTTAAEDPTGWVLEGSDDGQRWTTVDERRGEDFRWRRQTRAFSVAQPGAYDSYRIRFTGTGGAARTTLAEVELLGSGVPRSNPGGGLPGGGTTPGGGTPGGGTGTPARYRLGVSIRGAKAVRRGRTASMTVQVRNRGTRTLKRVKTCLALPARVAIAASRKPKLRRKTACWTVASLKAGRSAAIGVALRPRRDARTGRVRLRVTVSASPRKTHAKATRVLRVRR